MKKKVVLFVRVSTENQELDSQIEALKKSAYADGYTDDDIIIIAKKESGVKLKEAEREGLNDLKRVIERNIIDGVYLYELSRLSRDPISAIIGILIVALIVGGIAKLIGKDFEEWFAKGAVAWTFVELINGIIIMCS